MQVELEPQGPTAPPVAGLDACEAGPECNYGYAYERFKTWGNSAPEALGDCTFAAAANWEQVVMRWEPYEADLGYEFAEAGGTATGGLSMARLFAYWRHYGIAGLKLTGLSHLDTSKENVLNGVRDYGALIAELVLVANDGLGEYTAEAGRHAILVVGFTPEGPLVATWGEVLQMTWEQWEDEADGMWAVNTTNPPA